MRTFCTVLSLLSLGLLSGCNAEAPHVKPPEAATKPISYPGRFQLVNGQAFGIALDTKTGLLCHTFNPKADDYIPAGRGQPSGAIVGLPPGAIVRPIAPENTMGHYSLNGIPLCILLSQKENETIQTVELSNEIATTISEK